MNNNVDPRYLKAIVFAVALLIAILIFNSKIFSSAVLKTENNQTQPENEITTAPPIPADSIDLSDNYVSNAVNASGTYVIWQRMPIKVYISENPYKSIVKSAFENYNNNFSGIVNFTFTENQNDAQVTVTFPAKLENTNSEQFIAGITNNYSTDKYIQSSTMKLLTQKDGINLSTASVYNTALHEIGHSIGINGHSNNQKDIMYPQTLSTNIATFSARDIATIRVLYSKNENLISQNTATAGSEKLQEAIKYTQQVPNKTTGWINLGNVYYDLKMLPEALEAYKKALQIDPSDSNIYASMAGCYYSSKKYETAAQFYEYAKERTYDPVEIENYEAMIALSKLSEQKFEEAYRLYLALIDKYPNKKDYLINYLYLSVQLKKPDGKSKLEAFLQSHPDANNDANIQKYKSYFKIP